MMSSQDLQKLSLQTLEHFWGYSTFKETQEVVINSVLMGKDTVALLPTGGGKSLCYQLPALLLDGLCLVISPLLALMHDQVEQLKSMSIAAELISSDLDDFETEEILTRCKNGEVKLLYVSPERLKNSIFLQQIEQIQVSFIAVDEAHCISEWGQDFRPSFQHIKDFRNLVKPVPIIALTATATPKVLQDIQLKLTLKNANVFFRSFKRDNINIGVYEYADKFQKIVEWLRYNNQSGIIYTRTRKEAEDLSDFLQKQGIQNCDFFHAGLSAQSKSFKQKQWLQSHNNILVATNAFGMGIDKENVRFVIHLSVPPSIENYYQEIGRAGRDGQISQAFLLWNEQELNTFDDILKNSIPNQREFEKITTHLYGIFNIAENELPEEVFELNIEKLQKLTHSSKAKIKNVLQFLHHQEIIYYNPYQSQSIVELQVSADDLDSMSKKDAYFMELLFRTLPGISHHKVYFSEKAISEKMEIDILLIKERLKELHKAQYLYYMDGEKASVKFLEHRNDRALQGKYFLLFKQIQRNKLQKWEESKFFVRNSDYCKMKMILAYFGEDKLKNCGQCSVCQKSNLQLAKVDISQQILQVLAQKPRTIDEMSYHFSYLSKNELLEKIILLLDHEKIKMLDFKTYRLA